MVEFEEIGEHLVLKYTSRDGTLWMDDKWERGQDALLKGTYHLGREHLLISQDFNEDEDDGDDEFSRRFIVASRHGEYFEFNSEILRIPYPVLIHQSASISWKWFTTERRTSILTLVAELRPKRIVLGGDAEDAIPLQAYEALIKTLPTSPELKKYVLSRVSTAVREYVDTERDAALQYQKYLNKRLQRNPTNILGAFRQLEKEKFEYLLQHLTAMLNSEEGYSERIWQDEILQIILLLNPKYIKAIKSVRVPHTDQSRWRELDILLIDASGNVDVIEIKKPSDKNILTDSFYRDNYVPHRELSGSVMQLEKYLYFLNRWGSTGEKALTTRYANQLPDNFQIKITNPSGMIIMGRDNNLSVAQREDFEIVRRKYKAVVDIVTYDDLLRRLAFVLEQFSSRTSQD